MSTVLQATDSNPLVAYRAPSRMPRRHAPVADSPSGKHFVPDRINVANNRSPLNPFPGDLTYRPDPTIELDFGLWDDNGSPMSAKEGTSMMMFGLYKEAMAKDFIVADRVRMAWKPDAAGRLTFNGAAGGNTTTPATVLMWRTGEECDRVQNSNERLRESNDIQKSAEQRMAEKIGEMQAVSGNSDIGGYVKFAQDQPETVYLDDEE